MANAIELTLSSLLPTVSYLSPELLSLSASLIAQSRNKASTLKPEEEIGRTYACCHIACQRLGHRLALEIAKPAPPVQPKVYTKLHTYLNAVLKTTSTPRTPTISRTEDKLQHESSRKSARASTSQPTSAKKTTANTTPPSRKRKAIPIEPSEAHANAVPDSAHTIIRLACNSADAPEAIPHVFAGLSSVLNNLNYNNSKPTRATKRRKAEAADTPEEISAKGVPNLIIALVVVVLGRMHGEWNVDDPEVETEAGKAMMSHLAGTEFEEWDHENMMEDVDRWKKAVREVWAEMEWYQNIPACATSSLEEAELAVQGRGVAAAATASAKTPLRRKEMHAAREGDAVGAAGLLPGLGTMFQPAIDWLSEERREEYVQWKSDVLREVGVVR